MSSYIVDSRVTNETSSLAKEGYDVTVLCLNSKGLKCKEFYGDVEIKRTGICTKGKIFSYISAYVQMLWIILKSDFKLIHAHEITSLPVAIIASLLKRKKVIYDSHELWSESHHKTSNKFIISTISYIERMLCKNITIITVSESICEYLKAHFNNKDVHVVRNIPSYKHTGKYNLIREMFEISERDKVFIYQGLLSEARGVDLILDAAINVSKDIESGLAFVFFGFGEYAKEIEQKSKLYSNIYYGGNIPQKNLLKYTSSADIGLHGIKNTCLNHDYCLPNKVFEYALSGIPIIVPNLTELSAFLDEYKVGLDYEQNNVESLESSIRHALKEHVYSDLIKNVKEFEKKVTWEKEFEIIKGLYEKI